jgi:hypothetical protein
MLGNKEGNDLMEVEETVQRIHRSNPINISRSFTQSHGFPESPQNEFLKSSQSWTEESNLMKKNRYSPKCDTPLKTRRNFSFLKPIVIGENDFEPNYNLNNVIKIKENTNVTKLVLVKKIKEKTPLNSKEEAETMFGPYPQHLQRGH